MTTWTCPHCNHPQIASSENNWEADTEIPIGNTAIGNMYIKLAAQRCLNPSCKQPTVRVNLRRSYMKDMGGNRWTRTSEIVRNATLIPDSTAKPQPQYIPAALREDYVEACRISELSPKSSATLARRCLQGMIRNFCGISRDKLIKEIKALRQALDDGSAPREVTPESVDAIDHVRAIGNIGAHMEEDVDRIIPIDPGEAQKLIGLIELLFEEWYVARHSRQERLKHISEIAADKKEKRAEEGKS